MYDFRSNWKFILLTLILLLSIVLFVTFERNPNETDHELAMSFKHYRDPVAVIQFGEAFNDANDAYENITKAHKIDVVKPHCGIEMDDFIMEKVSCI